MALVVYTNVYSTIAQNNLTKANNSLAKSIERLSSGLRINHASDDASGLAISEKLRGQIRGMAKASMNAQDAISFLQTAEGGMEVIGDILQRMRELAVQAGNGAYTSNDRMELQKEVSQLKDEINRISSSTEFNTKKILTGESAALWSTSNPESIEAIVRGTPAEGNYRIALEATGGQNAVYKTDIMNSADIKKTIDTYDYNFKYTGTTSKASFANVYGEVKGEFDVEATVAPAAAAAKVDTIGKHLNKLQTGEDSTMDITLDTSAFGKSAYVVVEALEDGDLTKATKENTFQVSVYDGETGEREILALPNTDIAAAGTITVNSTIGGGNVVLNFNDVTKFAKGDKMAFASSAAVAGGGTNVAYKAGNNGVTLEAAAPAADTDLQYSIMEMDDTGNISVGTGTFRIDNSAAQAGNTSYVKVTPQATTKGMMELNASETVGTTVNAKNSYVVGGNYPDGVDVTVKNSAAITLTTAITGKYMQDLNLRATLGGAGTGETGSYLVESLKDFSASTISEATTADFRVTHTDAATGLTKEIAVTVDNVAGQKMLTFDGATVTLDGGGLTKGDKVLVKHTLAEGAAGGAGSANLGTDGLSIRVDSDKLDDASIFNVQMDAAGNVYHSEIKMSLNDNSAGTLSFDTPTAKVATLDTKLKDISRFTNADGRMVLDNTQTLTLFANGKTVEMTMEGNDTVKDFRDKLNQSLLDLGLGSGDANVDANLVRYVTEEDAQASGHLAVAGTFVFQAGIAGKASEIKFIGDQGVINGLSIAQIQDAENSDLDITVTDAHNGQLIGKDRVSDNILRGVIDGIDVKVSNPQLITSYNSTTGKITFTAPSEPLTMDLHVVDNRTAVQIGANEGQTLDISIGEMNTKALEIDDAYVTTFEESQKAITKFDQALAKVSGSRATLGAQINRLEYTMSNLAVSRQNLIAAESRIRDLDVAEESSTFARNQVLVNSAVAMLAQANAMPQTALQLIG